MGKVLHTDPYPRILGFVEHCPYSIESTQLCDGVTVRNAKPLEVEVINQMMVNWGTVGSKPSLNDRSIMVVASYTPPKATDIRDYSSAVDDLAHDFAYRAASLLRLAGRGPLAIRLVAIPLADELTPGYTLSLTDLLPPFLRSNYLEDESPHFYPWRQIIGASCKNLFETCWDYPGLKSTPGLRWFNNSYTSYNSTDSLVNLFIGLEQILMGRNEQRQITYRLARRGASCLATNPEDEASWFLKIWNGYSLRSRIVHGSGEAELPPDDMTIWYEIEDALRQCITLYLGDQDAFEARRIGREGQGWCNGGKVKCKSCKRQARLLPDINIAVCKNQQCSLWLEPWNVS